MHLAMDSAYHYMVRPESETNYFIHGDAPNYSPKNVTVYQSVIPGWVQPVILPDFSDPENDNESKNPNQLSDQQIDIASSTYYTHKSYKIWNEFDLENFSNQTIDFNPSFDTLTIHECKVKRDGVWINKLDMNELRIIQPEYRLNNNIYSAELFALLFLEDIREGDILDLSYSKMVQSFPLFSVYSYLQDDMRWEKNYLRFIKPFNRSFQSQIFPYDWSCYATENDDELILNIEPCSSYDIESDQPPGYPSIAQFEMSEYENWRDVVSQIIPLYQIPDDFHFDSEVLQLIEKWKNEGTTLEEQAILATRFVQDEIRYTGIETGMGGLQPTSPLATLQRRFGDCKGKSQLLRAFLDLLGIHSDLCLVSTNLCGSIRKHLPILSLFNHAILQINISDQIYFVDATAIYQGGPLSQSSCSFGAGLVISDDTNDLISIPMPTIDPEVDCQTIFEIVPDDPVTMSSTIHFYGSKANHYRALLKQVGLQKTIEPFQNFLETMFGEIDALTPVQVQDDRTTNHFTFVVNVALEYPWQNTKRGIKSFIFIPQFLAKYFLQSFDENRTTPLQLPRARIKESVTIQGGRLLSNTQTINHKAFTFRSLISNPSKVEYELLTHLDELSTDDLESYLDKLDEGFDAIQLTIKSS